MEEALSDDTAELVANLNQNEPDRTSVVTDTKSLRLWSDFAEEGRHPPRGPRYRSLGSGLYDGQRCRGTLDSAELAEHCARLLNQAALAATIPRTASQAAL